MTQLAVFFHPSLPNHVCFLQKSLYGLKRAPRAWYMRLYQFLVVIGFSPSKTDTYLFVYQAHGVTTYFLVYVDVLSSPVDIPHFWNQLYPS